MELHQVAQHADDLDRAVAFYTGPLGGSFLARFEPPGLAFVRFGGTRLLLERAAPSALIYLSVDDARTAAAGLASQGIAIATAPHMIHRDTDGLFGPPGWEEWLTFIHDSEGNLVGLASRHPPAD